MKEHYAKNASNIQGALNILFVVAYIIVHNVSQKIIVWAVHGANKNPRVSDM